MDNIIYSTKIFVGRQQEFELMKRALQSTDILVVTGIGGIGKTHLLNYFIQMLTKQDEHNQDLRVLIMKQPIDLYLTAHRQEIGLLESLSLELGVEYFPKFSALDNKLNDDNIQSVRSSFKSDYRELPCDRIVLLFDTFEQASTDAEKFFVDFLPDVIMPNSKTTVIIAGRPEETTKFFNVHRNRFVQNNMSMEFLRLRGLSALEISKYFEEQKKNFEMEDLDIPVNFIESIVDLTEGLPILVGLTFDWLRYGNLPEDILDFPSDSKEKFKQSLVEQINKIYYPVNNILLAMAHFSRRCNIELLKNILVLQDEDLTIFASLAKFSFVKYRPSTETSSESWTLHDEMRELVTKYVWSKLDPQYELRQKWTRKAITYYDELIREKHNSPSQRLEQQHLECEKLFYLRFVDKIGARAYKKHLWETKSDSTKRALVSILREFDRVFKQLDDDERTQLELDDSIIKFQNTFYTEPIKLQKRLIDKIKGDDTRRAEILSRLIFSYINNGQLDEGERLAQDSIDWLKQKLQENLDNESKNDFQRRISTLLNALGFSLRIRGQIEKAVHYYEQSLDTIPLTHEFDAELTATKINLAYVLHMMGKDERAIAHCQTALTLSEKRNDLYRLGLAHNVMGIIEGNALKEPQAEYHFREAIKNFDKVESKRGLAMAGIAHARMRRQIGWHKVNPSRDVNSPEFKILEAAQNEVVEAAKLIEEGNHIVLIDAWSEMGALCREQKQFSEAVKYFNKSIALAGVINNDYAVREAYHGIGLTYYLSGEYELASEFAEKAIKITDTEPSTYIKGRAQRTIASVIMKRNKGYEISLKLAVESFVNMMTLDRQSLSDSYAKKDMFRQEWIDWIKDDLLSGKNNPLPPDIIRNNCKIMLKYWEETYMDNQSLADRYPGFVITVQDILYMSDML